MPDMYRLVAVIDMDPPADLDLEVRSLRIELFESMRDPKTFRVQLWGIELFRLQARLESFVDHGNMPPPSDEELLVAWGWRSDFTVLKGDCFHANDQDEAERIAVDAAKKMLKELEASRCVPRRT